MATRGNNSKANGCNCPETLAPRPLLPDSALHEAGSAGTLAGELPLELFAGKGAGASGNGSWLQGFNARNVLSGKSPMNLVAADVSPLHLPLGKVRADSCFDHQV